MTTKTTSRDAVYGEMREMFGIVPKWLEKLPDQALSGFWGLMRDFYLAETTLPNKTKELIGIAVSGATRCRYCALFHTEGARLSGASDREIAEASAMGGMTMLGSTFLNAMQIDYDEFARETHKMIEYARAHAPKGKSAAQARPS